MVKSRIHADILQFYQQKIAKLNGESDRDWKTRIENNPTLMEEALASASFSEQIKLVAMRRALAMGGGRRVGSTAAGANNASTMSQRFKDDVMGTTPEAQERFAKAQVAFLNDAFEYGSPESGTIFWTGVDENKLVKQVRQWNSRFGKDLFGQLEATTDARYINGAFEWHANDAPVQTTQLYFGAVSTTFGHLTRGHVTSVQVWGLRNDSIFTTKELPTILNGMRDQLGRGKTPNVTDISIVLLDPKTEQGEYKIYTNNELGDIPIVSKSVPDTVSRWIRGRDDCAVSARVSSIIPARVKGYWYERGKVAPSAAALAIARDYPLIRRG